VASRCACRQDLAPTASLLAPTCPTRQGRLAPATGSRHPTDQQRQSHRHSPADTLSSACFGLLLSLPRLPVSWLACVPEVQFNHTRRTWRSSLAVCPLLAKRLLGGLLTFLQAAGSQQAVWAAGPVEWASRARAGQALGGPSTSTPVVALAGCASPAAVASVDRGRWPRVAASPVSVNPNVCPRDRWGCSGSSAPDTRSPRVRGPRSGRGVGSCTAGPFARCR
jgi:hypothetical protein